MNANYFDHMGDDLRVVDAARVSFASQSWYIRGDYVPNKRSRHYDDWLQYFKERDAKGLPKLAVGDYGLIRFLAEHNHWTPFGHPQITLRMKAPVPIRTQCFKSKQGFVENEESRRYISSRPSLYVPDHFRSKPDNAKQGSAGRHPDSDLWLPYYQERAEEAINDYMNMIEEGIAPEQARFILPQGVQVQWVWTGSLAAFARFANLRKASDAQGEVQQLAQQVSNIIEPIYPISWEALTK